jgi:hypothetical protein
VPDDPGEVSHVLQEPGNNRREIFDVHLKVALRGSEKKAENFPRRGFRCGSDRTGLFLAAGGEKLTDCSMKLLKWNACRLLARGRELALVNLLQSTGEDISTITECKIQEGSGEFSVTGYTTFTPPPNAGRKSRVLVLVKNDLAVRANVKVITVIMDPSVQSVWLHFSHHTISNATQGATQGAFVLGGIYREWTPLLNRKESKLRLGLLLTQISKAAEHGSQVVVHSAFNVDLDWEEDKGYYMAAMLTSLAECTSTAGLETHVTVPTFCSFRNFLPRGDAPSPSGDLQSPTGDGTRPAGAGQSPARGGQSPAGDFHKYPRLDYVYTKGLISEYFLTVTAKEKAVRAESQRKLKAECLRRL